MSEVGDVDEAVELELAGREAGFEPSAPPEEDLVKVHLFDRSAGKDELQKNRDTGTRTVGSDPHSNQIYELHAEYGARSVAPPYNPLLWAQLMEKSTRLQSCVLAMAENTVGLGWRVVPVDEITGETPQEVIDQVAAETLRLETLFGFPNDEMPLTEVFRLIKIDEEATGNGYLEVVRDVGGLPSKLFHIPSHTMRVDREGGFIQKRGGRLRSFKLFGDKRERNAINGKWAENPNEIAFEDRANEIIHFKIYTPRDSYYGIPRIVCAAPAVTGNRLAAVRNAAFFENDAVPRLAVIVSGGHLTPTSAKDIRNFLQSDGKGPSNANRVMVIEAEGKKVSMSAKQEPVKITLQPLTVGETDDASFQQYRKMNDDEIREAFRIGSIFLGSTEHVNRASAMISRRITIEQVFKPEQLRKEYIVNHKLVRAMGCKHVRFEFVRAKSDDPVDTAPADGVHARFGGLTPNDIRRERGLEPYPKTEKWADLPFDLARIMFQAQVMGKPAEQLPEVASPARADDPLEDEQEIQAAFKRKAELDAEDVVT